MSSKEELKQHYHALVDMGRYAESLRSNTSICFSQGYSQRPFFLNPSIDIGTKQWHPLLHIRPLPSNRTHSPHRLSRSKPHLSLRCSIPEWYQDPHPRTHHPRRHHGTPPFQTHLQRLPRPRNADQNRRHGSNAECYQRARSNPQDRRAFGLENAIAVQGR